MAIEKHLSVVITFATKLSIGANAGSQIAECPYCQQGEVALAQLSEALFSCSVEPPLFFVRQESCCRL
jgi:hypothetical protein